VILPPVPGLIAQPPPLVAHLCARGYTSTIRPPASYTSGLKRVQLADFSRYHRDLNPADYEEDHLIPLELGGSPHDSRNLWPQPWPQAHRDDQLEDQLHRELCDGSTTLRRAQAAIRAYKRTHG
jgi:hypothetical protein